MRIAILCTVSGLAVCLLLSLACPVTAQAAYGKVWVNRGGHVSVPKGATVHIACPPGTPTARVQAPVGEGGMYETKGAWQGRCDVRVEFEGRRSNAVVVYFGGEPTRVNLELLPSKQGLTIRRR